jgi:lysophospholipase L1-like esterase
MLLKKSIIVCVFMLFFTIRSYSQKIEKWALPTIESTLISKIDYSKNVLVNTNSLLPLLTKLYKIKRFSNEKAVIVHLGDSHIQADMMTAIIRNSFQSYFGNAGRGLVFPFKIAKSNAPNDLISSSESVWKGNRITKTDTIVPCGISGFGLQSQNTNPSFNFELRTINNVKETFDRISFFMGGAIKKLQIENLEGQIENVAFNAPKNFYTFNFKTMTSGFKLSFPTTDTVSFYGASLEKKDAGGVIYHSIGVNGAKYTDYEKTPLFWDQLEKLKADCYVISLGTNEAQDQSLTAESILEPIKIMVNRLKLISPNACIILTTPPVSYYKKSRPNRALAIITKTTIDYCNENNIVYWDLFNVGKGLKGAQKWKSAKLLQSDLVHFSREGYTLQGNLFVDAFAKVWNGFLSKN